MLMPPPEFGGLPRVMGNKLILFCYYELLIEERLVRC
jgi:hypothetical protein